MGHGPRYIVLGAGKQGTAAAHDLLNFGDAERLTILDADASFARRAARHLRSLLPPNLKNVPIRAGSLDGKSLPALRRALRGHRGVLSALPYYLNPVVARAAVGEGLHYVDLGGHFETTQKILSLDRDAQRAGVALIPDCGIAPGLCNSLAALGISRLDRVDHVRMYCGGLPEHPVPPLGYKLVFNLEGVLGNYFGKAFVLENGQVKEIPSFTEREELDFPPPLGRLEAFVTGGATSTAPWTYEGRVRSYTYKTLRWPGHHEKIRTLKELGLLDTSPVKVKGGRAAPLDVFLAAAGPKLTFADVRDLLVMRVTVEGMKGGRASTQRFDILEYEDPRTGFSAMQRTTGFPAAVVLEMLVRGEVNARGVAPIERSIPPGPYVDALGRRGIRILESSD
jgi:lysine 6-dehydrogenase